MESRTASRRLSGAADRTVRLWEAATGHGLRVLEGHTGQRRERRVESADGRRRCLRGRLTRRCGCGSVESGHGLRVLEGHTASVVSVAWWSPTAGKPSRGRLTRQCACGKSVTGHCLRVLEGHTDECLERGLESADGQRALSGAG